MKRRDLLQMTAAAPALAACAQQPQSGYRRNRPGDAGWPAPAQWHELNAQVGGRLIEVHSPIDVCRAASGRADCETVFRRLKNPWYIGDNVALTQTTGWVDAWTSSPSVYAVAARNSVEVTAAVNFARTHRLRLVVKGGGHSYQGTSNAPDSLLVWTRPMDRIELHDAFVPQGCNEPPRRAVSLGAGTVWLRAYAAVARAGRYVQGGGCATVNVAGLIQSGGFGSFSKRFGSASAGLLEAEVVTADGAVRIANACANPDLFWALKGGGGGSFGVVTRVTLRTRELPNYLGGVMATVQAHSPEAFRRLIERFMGFYRDSLFNPHWGEIVQFRPDNAMVIAMVFQGLDRTQASAEWRPFFGWLAGRTDDYRVVQGPNVIAVPGRHFWDAAWLKRNAPQAVLSDDRPGAPADNVFWSGNLGEAGWFVHGYESAWLPAALLEPQRQGALLDALFAASRHNTTALHFNKGLAGAPTEDIVAARGTAVNPSSTEAFALAISAASAPPAFAGIRGHEPDLVVARANAKKTAAAIGELRKLAPDSGAYLTEASYFQQNWQRAFWGPNYERLRAIKAKYDPEGLFFIHHGVGSEGWSADGFTRLR